MKKIAILQSNYIPWKGYFDLINMVDEFIFYDTVQYTKNDWRNRNLIKTANGTIWLTIPVRQASLKQTIAETNALNNSWRKKHWNAIKTNYSKAPSFKEYEAGFEELYLGSDEHRLSIINLKFIEHINALLRIKTKLSWSSDYELKGGKSERLVNLCKQVEGTTYVSGPTAKDYLDEEVFLKEGLSVEWMDYSDYPTYSQLHPPFTHKVSILDLLFNEGKNARNFLKSASND